MRDLTLKQIEEMCDKHLLAFLGESPSLVDPIDIDGFLTDYLETTIYYRKLSKLGNILGISIFSDIVLEIWKDDECVNEMFPGKTVIIDESLLDDKQLGRRNYTKAHEAVHGIVFKEFPPERTLYYRNEKAASDFERMIDCAASRLILPETLVRNVFSIYMGAEHISRINPLHNTEIYKRFCFMANHLCVSKKALSIRLLKLGLIDFADYERPHDFLNIYCEVDK